MEQSTREFDRVAQAAEQIARRGGTGIELALVLGSGLGPFADELTAPTVIPYQELPGFPQPTVPGHSGRLVLGTIAGVRVAVLQGRAHYYEGHSAADAVRPLRTLITLGAKGVVVTNAAGGIHPGFYAAGDVTGQVGADVLISVTPPPQMPATLEAGTINGYCVGEPWNQQAIFKNVGVPVITDYEIWKNNPEKVFGLTAEFAQTNPQTTLALTKALIRAAIWLDEGHNANRAEAVEILSRPDYVGADAAVLSNSMTGSFEYEKGDVRPAPDFNVFFRYNATFPYYSDAVWYLTQMRRWGQIAEAKPDAWFDDVARSVYKPDLYKAAAEALIAEGKATPNQFDFDADGYRDPSADFIDGVSYDGTKPNAYIDSLTIGLKGAQTVSGGEIIN